MARDELTAAEEELNEAIHALYTTFQRYHLYPPTGICPYCYSEEDDRLIHSKRLREFTAADLGRFASKAMTTWGSVTDFKHMLPRLFELAATVTRADLACPEEELGRELASSVLNWSCMEILFGKLPYGDWRRWPRAEQEAIRRYLAALFRKVVTAWPSPIAMDINELLCALGKAEDDLSAYLQTWRNLPGLAPRRHLANCVEDNGLALAKHRRLSNAFWRDRKPQMQQVIAWLLEPATRDQLEQAFFEYQNDPEAAEAFSSALTTWEWIRTAMGS